MRKHSRRGKRGGLFSRKRPLTYESARAALVAALEMYRTEPVEVSMLAKMRYTDRLAKALENYQKTNPPSEPMIQEHIQALLHLFPTARWLTHDMHELERCVHALVVDAFVLWNNLKDTWLLRWFLNDIRKAKEVKSEIKVSEKKSGITWKTHLQTIMLEYLDRALAIYEDPLPKIGVKLSELDANNTLHWMGSRLVGINHHTIPIIHDAFAQIRAIRTLLAK